MADASSTLCRTLSERATATASTCVAVGAGMESAAP